LPGNVAPKPGGTRLLRAGPAISTGRAAPELALPGWHLEPAKFIPSWARTGFLAILSSSSLNPISNFSLRRRGEAI
jgi:hypothetical protein